MTEPTPAPQPNGSYAHEITGPDGRLIEAYTPQPLDPAEIEALLAQSYADRPDQQELARMIMEMEGPEMPAPLPPDAVPAVGGTTHDPVYTNDIGPSSQFRSPVLTVDADRSRFSDPEATLDVSTSNMWDVNLDRGADDDWYRGGGDKDPAIGYIPNDGVSAAAQQATPEPSYIGKTDAYGRGWWQQPLGDDIPDEFRDLFPTM